MVLLYVRMYNIVMIRILGKIELPEEKARGKEKISHRAIREQALQRLSRVERENVHYLQSLLAEAGAPQHILDHEGAIAEEAFRKSRGGHYEDAWIDENRERLQEKQEKAAVRNEKRDGYFAEKVLPILFNKLFQGSDYLMLNTHPEDDLEHGVDQIIFDMRTGRALCALDEIVTNDALIAQRPEKEENFQKKMERILRKHEKKHGVSVTYGMYFHEGKFQKLGPLRNLDLAVMRVERRLFYEVLRDMNFSIHTSLGEAEQQLMHYITLSLEKQIVFLESHSDKGYEDLRKLHAFLQERLEEA